MPAAPNNQYHKVWTDEELDKLGEELIRFAEFDRSIHWARFCRTHKKSRQWLLDLSKHYPKFNEYYQIARELMSAKISDLCFYDKESGVNSNFGRDNLFRYDDEWVEHIKWKAEIQKDVQGKDNNKCIFNEALKELKADD
jgi:hypothetical protein